MPPVFAGNAYAVYQHVSFEAQNLQMIAGLQNAQGPIENPTSNLPPSTLRNMGDLCAS